MTHPHHGPDLTANAPDYAERYDRMVGVGTGPALARFLGFTIGTLLVAGVLFALFRG